MAPTPPHHTSSPGNEPPSSASTTPSPSSLPPNFTEEKDPATDRTYWINHETKKSSWLNPLKAPYTPGLPFLFERITDAKGRAAHQNHETKSSSWLNPVKVEKLKKKGKEGDDMILREVTDGGDEYSVSYETGTLV